MAKNKDSKIYKLSLDLSKPLSEKQLKEWQKIVDAQKPVIALAEQAEKLKQARDMVDVKPNQIVRFSSTFQLYGNTYDAVVQTDAGTMVFIDTKHYFTEEL